MPNDIEQKFRGTQENTCESANMGLRLYLDNLPDFTKSNLKYTKAWGTAFGLEITNALSLPDVYTRRSKPGTARAVLMPLAQSCTDNWLILSGIITNVYPEGMVESVKMDAGYGNYVSATKCNWPKVKALMTAGATFIAENVDTLLNNGGGMAPGFPDAFNLSKAAFEEGMDNFYGAKKDLPVGSISKVEAMNNVYDKLMGMLSDAKKIYKRNKAVRSMFSYTSLPSKVQGAGQTGFRFTVQQEETLLPSSSTTIIVNPGNIQVYTDAKGIALINTKEGKVSFTATTPGFDTVEGALKADTGVMHRVDLVLIKAAGKQSTA